MSNSLSGVPTLARCRNCGKRTDRVVTLRETPLDTPRHVWECASCEYLRLHPDAERGTAHPREKRPAKLQAETLF